MDLKPVLIPAYILNWFQEQAWTMHEYQKQMFSYFKNNESTLLIAPTGGGKTLASFLPALADIKEKNFKGLHTLYISPLKSLTEDIQRNLLRPIKEMQLAIEVATRTGDTPNYQRQKQLKKPPHILLTTPESLMLVLSYPNARVFFKYLKLIIVDELHNFCFTKRGDLASLALAQIRFYAKPSIIGLSATVSEPKSLASWLSTQEDIHIIEAKETHKPKLGLIESAKIPYCGYKAKHAITDIYKLIANHNFTLIFVNTRANAEFLFSQLWLSNIHNFPIAIYHGSLSKEQRRETELLSVQGKLKAIVATSALELGIDWKAIDVVVQIGAPHGVTRLIQRIGRSNHHLAKASLAYLVPTNCFDTLESLAAISAISKGKLDKEEAHNGALDVVVQFIINSACSEGIKPTVLYKIVRSAEPYRKLTRKTFLSLFEFAINGGYTLKHYPQYHRLVKAKNFYQPTSSKVVQRHRQNIGTIVDSPRLRVKVLNKKTDKIIGDIEEGFIQELIPGESFLFGGLILEYLRIHNMFVETRKLKSSDPKLLSYKGSTMPLSTFLAEELRSLLTYPKLWSSFPAQIVEWLELQKKFSQIPDKKTMLIEEFLYKKVSYLVIYSFEGRKANQSLGFLLTRRMESLKLKPLSFTITDYALAIKTLVPLDVATVKQLFAIKVLSEELEAWLQESSLLKRTFRKVAVISGLTERQLYGQHKSMKQVTFSTDLIFDVLKRYEPEHILLKITRDEVIKELLDFKRLTTLLKRFQNKISFKFLKRPSPFAIPLLFTFTTEKIKGEAEEELLTYAEVEAQANLLIKEVKDELSN